ncbi:hypothetical protein ABBQ38_007161 [Trebouxia sp. C0009 RCD-2024]
MKAAHQHSEAAVESDPAQRPEPQVFQQSLDTEAPDSRDAQGAHSPVAVLATAVSLQEVQAGPSSGMTQDERPHADIAAASPAAPVVASPELAAEEQPQASEPVLASTSKRKKRKQSAVGESLVVSDTKRWRSSTAKLRQTDSPTAGSPAVEHEQSANLEIASGPTTSGNDLRSQPEEALTLADSTDKGSPSARNQTQASPVPISHRQSSATLLVDPMPECSGAPAADAVVDDAVAASLLDARNSDFQDAQERLSSPLHVSTDSVRSVAEQQPAESSPASMQEDEPQAASPSPLKPSQAQAAEAPRHSPIVVESAQASPVHVCVGSEPGTLVLDKAEAASSAAAAGLDAPTADSTADLQTNSASALGAAAAVPLPSSASTQGV